MKMYMLIGILFTVVSCQPSAPNKASKTNEKQMISINSSHFGKIDGQDIQLYTLKNEKGFEVKITNYGGIVTSIITPDKNGVLGDVALGYDSLDDYLAEHPFFGAIIGRYGNRIANGRFTIEANEYQLAINNGDNSLHGGNKGFDKQIWNVSEIENGLSLSRTSPDMEEGYPGNLDVIVTYQITTDNQLVISYEAKTDKTTVCNLTNHSYFNLAGEGHGTILDHSIIINADQYNPVDEGLIPTGIDDVVDTPFDFRSEKRIGQEIDADHPQIAYGGGYDHNFVLRSSNDDLVLAAKVTEPSSGRILEVMTTEPGIQFYCGNFLDGSLTGKRGTKYEKRSGFCLETQHFPDSPNKTQFPSTLLQPGETYRSKTIYKFSTMN